MTTNPPPLGRQSTAWSVSQWTPARPSDPARCTRWRPRESRSSSPNPITGRLHAGWRRGSFQSMSARVT
jgi:hypothetical protein